MLSTSYTPYGVYPCECRVWATPCRASPLESELEFPNWSIPLRFRLFWCEMMRGEEPYAWTMEILQRSDPQKGREAHRCSTSLTPTPWLPTKQSKSLADRPWLKYEYSTFTRRGVLAVQCGDSAMWNASNWVCWWLTDWWQRIWDGLRTT